MRIINLKSDKSTVYTSNAYLVLGDFSTLADINTLIDTGSDPAIIERISLAPTGVGKKSIEQVLLTHTHSDHMSLLPKIRDLYGPVVGAGSAFSNADFVLKNGQVLHCGDRYFEVIHSPGHSSDSICFYCQSDGVLFVGDTCVVIRNTEGTYEDAFVEALEQLCRRDVRTIYFGHGQPMVSGAMETLRESLRNVLIATGKHHGG